MTVSQYAYPYPAVKPYGEGWRTDVEMRGGSEGLLWVVRTREGVSSVEEEERIREKLEEAGVTSLPPLQQRADEYILADRVEIRGGCLIMELGTPQHIVSVKVYSPGSWYEFHLLSDPKEIASRAATYLKEDEVDA